VSVTGFTIWARAAICIPVWRSAAKADSAANDFADGRLEIGQDCVLREMVSMHVGSRKGGGLTMVGADGYFMVQFPMSAMIAAWATASPSPTRWRWVAMWKSAMAVIFGVGGGAAFCRIAEIHASLHWPRQRDELAKVTPSHHAAIMADMGIGHEVPSGPTMVSPAALRAAHVAWNHFRAARNPARSQGRPSAKSLPRSLVLRRRPPHRDTDRSARPDG